MSGEFEVAWHGARWRDDRLEVVPSTSHPQGLSPTKRPNERRGGRKPVIAPAVAKTLRTAEKPLSALEVFARIRDHISANCTVAGVNSALFRLRTEGFIEACERRATFGRFGCTYRWVDKVAEPGPSPAERGRMGGLKKAENERHREAYAG